MFKFEYRNKPAYLDLFNNKLKIQDEIYNLTMFESRPQAKIYLKFNSNCNINCNYCFQRKDLVSTPITNIEVFETIIRRELLKEKAEIVIFGGEPLISSNLNNISKVFSWSGTKKITFYTNCCHDKETRCFIIRNKLKISKLIVTIDGPEKIHNERRKLNGQSGFKLIMSNLKHYIDNGIKCFINYNIDKHNLEYVKNFHVDVQRKFGKDKISIILNKTLHEKEVLNEEQLIEAYINLISDNIENYSNVYINSIVMNKLMNYILGNGGTSSRCRAGDSYVIDFTNHSVYACAQSVETKIGYISQSKVYFDFDTITDIKKYSNKDNEKCNYCSYKKICGYGCIVSKDTDRNNCKDEVRGIINLILSNLDLLL